MALLDRYTKSGLDDVACNLCGGRRTERLPFRDRFGTRITAVICTGCGLMYLNPRWKAAAYAAFYAEDYRKLMRESDEPPRELMLRQRVHGAAICGFCSPFLSDRAAILDIGCGAGGVLNAFQLAGPYALAGIEPSEEHSRFARESLGLQVQTGLFGLVELPAASYDLVILTQTLNHLLDPAAAIRSVRALLKPGGLFFVEVQNFPEYARGSRRPIQVDHTYYFSPETLECLCRRAGLEPVRTEVDTAAAAALVPRYMWHRGASIHVRMLLRRSEPDAGAALPDYRTLRRQAFRGWQSRVGRAVLLLQAAAGRLFGLSRR